jgi:hypothetical protein
MPTKGITNLNDRRVEKINVPFTEKKKVYIASMQIEDQQQEDFASCHRILLPRTGYLCCGPYDSSVDTLDAMRNADSQTCFLTRFSEDLDATSI